MLLELEQVSKSYAGRQGTVRALDRVSLAIDSGQFLAVQGPSGSGKSTLLLVAGGLLRPDSGQVRVSDCNPYQLSADERAQFRARNIGFVYQQFHLVPYLSVLDNVLAPALAVPQPQARGRARELIERFGLAHRAEHMPGELSSGERQRTGMARALLNRPQLILADEPTGNLDRENADVVLGFLADFVAEGGSVLLVTHDPLAAERAQTVIRLRDGQVVTQTDEVTT